MASIFYENFLQLLAQTTSYALTTKETAEILKRISSLHHFRRHSFLIEEEPNPDKSDFCRHSESCYKNAIRGFIRTFLVAFTVKYGVDVVSKWRLIFKKPRVMCNLAGKDTVGFASFLASFVGGYKITLCFLRRLGVKDEGLSSFLAGIFGATSLGLDFNRQRRVAVALYLSTKSLEYFCVYAMDSWRESRLMGDGDKKKWLKVIDEWVRRWSGLLLMMLTSSQIVYAFLNDPVSLPKSYYSFLLVHSGKKVEYGSKVRSYMSALFDVCRKAISSQNLLTVEDATQIAKEYQVELLNLKATNGVCAMIHPNHRSCEMAAAHVFSQEFVRALRLYSFVNTVCGF